MLDFNQRLRIKQLLFNAWERAFLADIKNTPRIYWDTEETILSKIYDDYAERVRAIWLTD